MAYIIVLLDRAGLHTMLPLLLSYFSCFRLFVTLWTMARQAPLSMGFFKQEYWSGLPCPPLQGIFPTQGSNLSLLCLLNWQVGSSPYTMLSP